MTVVKRGSGNVAATFFSGRRRRQSAARRSGSAATESVSAAAIAAVRKWGTVSTTRLRTRARSVPIEHAFADVESLLRSRAEQAVARARENDERQLKEFGAVGRWLRDRAFPLFAPLIARQLEQQYAFTPGV